jgi:Fur family transcriptional regulator, ferric uptake regulator
LTYFICVPHNKNQKDQLAIAQARYAEFLKRNKMFLTKERTALLEFIFAQNGHFSADELLFEMQRTGLKASRATLYRTLSQLIEAGVLSESDFGHGHTHYEIDMGDRPHAHLVSLDSDDVREVTSDKLEAAIAEILRKENFAVRRFNIQIFGSFAGKKKG